MPLDLKHGNDQFDSELDFFLRFQDVLLRAVEGVRDAELNREYKHLRAALMADDKYESLVPQFVRRHRDLDSLWPTLKSFNASWEPRRVEVRRQFEPAIAEADRIERSLPDPYAERPSYDPSAWTGATTAAARLQAVKTLIPVAQASTDRLIATLEAPSHNGGPPLDGREEAIEALRSLHAALGRILDAADAGTLDQAYNGGLVAEASSYARRAAKKLRDDPLPYAMSGLILAVFSACGFPGLGGFLSGVAANIQKSG